MSVWFSRKDRHQSHEPMTCLLHSKTSGNRGQSFSDVVWVLEGTLSQRTDHIVFHMPLLSAEMIKYMTSCNDGHTICIAKDGFLASSPRYSVDSVLVCHMSMTNQPMDYRYSQADRRHLDRQCHTRKVICEKIVHIDRHYHKRTS